MKVILKERVRTLGNAGDIVNVSAGYARNYLIPQSKAVIADEKNTKRMADIERMLAKKIEAEKQGAIEVQNKLKGFTLELIKKVGGNGTLFGTVTSNEIARELEQRGIEVEKRHIIIETPIKVLGNHQVKAKLFKDVEASFQVKVDMSEAQRAEIEAKQKEAARKKKALKEKAEKQALEAEAHEKKAEGEELENSEETEA